MTAARAGQVTGGSAPQPVSRPRPVRGYASGKDGYLRLLRARAWPPALQRPAAPPQEGPPPAGKPRRRA